MRKRSAVGFPMAWPSQGAGALAIIHGLPEGPRGHLGQAVAKKSPRPCLSQACPCCADPWSPRSSQFLSPGTVSSWRRHLGDRRKPLFLTLQCHTNTSSPGGVLRMGSDGRAGAQGRPRSPTPLPTGVGHCSPRPSPVLSQHLRAKY